jgi:hypothetical protein
LADLAREHVDEAKRADGRVGEVVHDVALLLKVVGELAEQEALAAARLGDERRDAVDLDRVAQPLERLGEAAMAMQGGLGRVAAEWVGGEAEVADQRVGHGDSSTGMGDCRRASTKVRRMAR